MQPDINADDRYEPFLQHFSRHREQIFAYVASLLPHHADAEDVFQRCSLLLWRKFDTFDSDRVFLPWACGVAYFEVRNFLRVAARDHHQFDDQLISQLAQHRLNSLSKVDDRFDALQQCVSKLKDTDRELMDLVYRDDRSVREFAEATGQARQTLYNRLTQLRRQLLQCIERRLVASRSHA